LGKSFYDGGLFNNNSARIALQELKLLWLEIKAILLDILLSVGSGHSEASNLKHQQDSDVEVALDSNVDSLAVLRNLLKRTHTYRIFSVLKNRFKQNLNSEKMWREFFQTRVQQNPGRYVRLNVRLNMRFEHKQPALDDKTALHSGYLENEAERYIKSIPDTINLVVRRLVASAFYFEPFGYPWDCGHGQVCQAGNTHISLFKCPY
jgi:hypothetical protein